MEPAKQKKVTGINRQICRLVYVLLVLLGLIYSAHAEWIMQESHSRASFRGVQAVSSKIVWVSGTGGSCLRTLDGGKTWETFIVSGAEKLDFRGVAACDAKTAVLISSGDAEKGQTRIYRTADGGKTWKLVCESWEKGAFFDGIAFWDKNNGFVVGDPIDGRWYLLKTSDGGKTWERFRNDHLPAMHPGEGAFAAGNSSMQMQGSSKVWLASGAATNGEPGRVFFSNDRGANWEVVETPMAGGESAGIFGLRFWDSKHGIGVGGDYKRARAVSDNIILTSDGGKTWQKGAPTDPPGHKESAVMLGGNKLIVVGPSGTSLSKDGGKSWTRVDDLVFHAVSASGSSCWAVGNRGAIAKWK